MFTEIVTIVSDIEIRLIGQWKDSCLPAFKPTLADVNEPMALFDQCIRQWASGSLTDPKNAFSILGIERLVKCHEHLSAHHWCDVLTASPLPQMDWYERDLLVYCGLSYLMIKTFKFLIPIEWEDRLPPMVNFLPRVESPFMVVRLVEKWSPQLNWLLVDMESLLPVRKELALLDKVASCRAEHHPLLPLAVTFARCPSTHRFESLARERMFTRSVEQMGRFISHQFGELPFEERGRCLFKHLLEVGEVDDHFAVQVVAGYLGMILEVLSVDQLQNEMQYWEVSRWPAILSNQNFLQQLEHAVKKKSETDQPIDTYDKLFWKGSGEKLAATFVDWIRNGEIQYQGNGDITPIAVKLYRFFAIQKKKGDGYLTESSFVSYCKKCNSDIVR